jgi:hypothetical protein
MTFTVRFPLWFMAGCAGAPAVFGAVSLAAHLRSPAPDLLFGAIGGLILACVTAVFRDLPATLKVEPHRIVSGFGQGSTVVPLGPADRLVALDRRLWVVRATGHWEEVTLWSFIMRGGDWHAFETAVSQRWPMPLTPPTR